MSIPFEYFLIALVATFIGAIPFGAINLSVVNTTIKKSFAQGVHFSFATSLVEIAQAGIAIFFGLSIQRILNENSWIQIVVFSIFIALGVYNLVRKTHPKLGEKTKLKVPEFVKGFVISVANPQAVPFWLITLTLINQYFKLDYTGSNLTIFLIGVFVGKLLALLLFGVLSNFLKEKLQKSCTLINRSLGSVLLLIGLFQASKYFYDFMS